MEFYKVENGKLIKAPKNGLKVFIGNPTEEHYKFFGYTDEIVEDEPLEEQEGKSIEEWYEQKDDIIYRHYRYVDIESPDDYEEGTDMQMI